MSRLATASPSPWRAAEAQALGVGAAGAVAAASALVPALCEEAADVDVDGAFPVRSFDLLREHGLLRAPLPPRYGGVSLGDARFRLQLLQVLAHLGRGSLPVGRVYEGHVNALALIETFATPRQADLWFGEAAAGHLFAVWNTEGGDGLHLQADGHGALRLRGSKTFASGAGFASRAVVTGKDSQGGWQMLVAPVDRWPVGIDRSFWTPLGMRASASFKVGFDGVIADPGTLLGSAGDYYREPAFGTGAIRFAAVQLGGIEAVFDATRAFLRRLGRTDDPYQRARIGEMAMWAASGRQWLAAAAGQAIAPADSVVDTAAGSDHGGAIAHAHLMRTAIETIALRMMPLAERCVGARGLMAPEPLERLHRDLTHYLRQAAPDAAIAAAGAFVLSRPQAAPALWQE